MWKTPKLLPLAKNLPHPLKIWDLSHGSRSIPKRQHHCKVQPKGRMSRGLQRPRAISGLEATGDFSALYDRMHPDAKAIVPREVVVGWFGGYFAGKETTGITVTGVHFVSWTWSVTGVTYSHTAGVFFVQPIRVNGEYTEIEDVVRLVQDDTGEWRWFFGRSTEFVNEQIDKYAP